MDNPDINILQIIKTLEGEKQLLELKLAHYERMIELMRRMLLSEPQATEESEADDDGPVKKEVPWCAIEGVFGGRLARGRGKRPYPSQKS